MDADYFNVEAARHGVEEAHARFEELKKHHAAEREREKREHEEICRVRSPDFTVRRALITAYLLGRSGMLVSERMLDDLMQGLENYDASRQKRDVMLRVIPIGKRDGK